MATLTSRFLRLALAGAIAALAACGDDSSPAAAIGSATGTLSDSPVAGVAYTTSSGVTGITDGQGRFRYNPGDTVTFRIGSLTLGAVTATGTDATITPLQIAKSTPGLTETQQQNLVTNLLVLLQSLDSDGNAENGISIPAAVGAALNATVAGTIELDVAPATFAGSSAVISLASTAGGSVVDPEEALAHFRTQFFKDIAGVYTANLGNDEIIAFRFNADGSYLMAEVAAEDAAGLPGIERGKLDWNAQTGAVAGTNITLDTNGEWGLSDPRVDETVYLSVESGKVVFKTDYDDPAETDETLELTRLENGSGLAGAWALNRGNVPASSLDVQQFLFLADGRYLMIDTVGDDEYNDTDDPKCGDPGLEFGHYSLAGGVLSTSEVILETNDCAGLHDNDIAGAAGYSQFTEVSIGNGAVMVGEEVLLVVPETAGGIYTGESEVTATTTGTPVVQESGAYTLFCSPPDELHAISSFAASIHLDAEAGSFTMKYADEGEPVSVTGSYNAATGAMAWQETEAPHIVLQSGGTTYYSEGSLVYTATYNAESDSLSGSVTDTVSTSWSRDSSKVTCTATSMFSLARAGVPSAK
jgi:hypothetical protein